MQLSSILLTLVAAAAVTARGHSNSTMSPGMDGGKSSDKADSDRQKCESIHRMQTLVELAANTTRLDRMTHSNATRTSEIEAKASSAAAALPSLEANATLMATCSAMFAMEDTMDDCERMWRIQREDAWAANATALADKFKNNQTKIDAFKAKAAEKSASLAPLTSNTTLTSICAAAETMGQCGKMKALEREVKWAGNDTLLADKFHNDQTKIDQFKAEAATAQVKLSAMQANTTLAGICQSATAGKGATSSDSTGSTTPSIASTPSAAIRSIEAASGVIALALGGVMAVMFSL